MDLSQQARPWGLRRTRRRGRGARRRRRAACRAAPRRSSAGGPRPPSAPPAAGQELPGHAAAGRTQGGAAGRAGELSGRSRGRRRSAAACGAANLFRAETPPCAPHARRRMGGRRTSPWRATRTPCRWAARRDPSGAAATLPSLPLTAHLSRMHAARQALSSGLGVPYSATLRVVAHEGSRAPRSAPAPSMKPPVGGGGRMGRRMRRRMAGRSQEGPAHGG
jgi:hypothetical protein